MESSHNELLLSCWDRQAHVVDSNSNVLIDGATLSLANIVAVSRHGNSISFSPRVVGPIEASAAFLESALEQGDCIYGVNTGFGGNADTRTRDLINLQRTVIRQLHYGIISSPAEATPGPPHQNGNADSHGHRPHQRRPLPNEDPFASTTMPEAWVRASTLIRINSLALGHSGISLSLLEDLGRLITDNVTPIIPLRGSISASGDRSPLSYLAGVLQGNPNVKARIRDSSGQQHIVPADTALHMMRMAPRELGPKEGLAIVNGTAVSAGVAALALYDAHYLALMAQVLTAMGVEAMNANTESFDQFMADVRPHPGQIESCKNIRGFLQGSKLVSTQNLADGGVLRQDRYALRTSTQWLGPQLEDLLLAHQQILIECNSATDNPLIDVKGAQVLHGGNFQAQAVTTAVEKMRLSLQKMGRMLFAQSAELVNPALNNGLPPNLVADEPSRSFLMKSVDISTAAYMSELSYLSNPVGTHVMSAELGNQSINSVALISARYTHMACDVLSQLCAAYLYSLCQALDLRALNLIYLRAFQPVFDQLIVKCFRDFVANSTQLNSLAAKLWADFQKELVTTTSMDAKPRFVAIFNKMRLTLLDYHLSANEGGFLHAMRPWTEQCSKAALDMFLSSREQYAMAPDATPYLGQASVKMYTFVRRKLRVPFLKRDMRLADGKPAPVGLFEELPGFAGSTGTMMTAIYESFRSGDIYGPAVECLRDTMREARQPSADGGGSAYGSTTASSPASKKRAFQW